MPKKQIRHKPPEIALDPLGKLIKSYRPNVAVIVGLAVIILLAGAGILVYCHFRDPYPFKLMILGLFLLAMGPMLVAINVVHFGSWLEVRRHGLRLHDHSGTTELEWEEIVDVEVKRTDVTGLGFATVWTKRSDLKSGGPLTARTEWEVILHTRDGQPVRLRPGFLQYIGDVRSLIILLRKCAGLR